MEQKAKIVAAGTTKVTELTEAEKDAFREAFKPVHNEFRDIIGGDLIDAVYELNAQN
jgi:TRAP-type C4-dicarboxylate transport system substrate-binding protein